MPEFGKTSLKRLNTCHSDIRTVMHHAIEIMDFSVIEGHRTHARQAELYQQGRDKDGNIVDKTKVVTYALPGESNHNYDPSRAIDIVPWPTQYACKTKMRQLAAVVLAKAEELDIKLVWGGDWNGDGIATDFDLPHFELAK